MTNAPPPKHARGKHAKPPSELSLRWDRLVRTSLGEPSRRKLVAAGTGTATVVLLAVAAVAGLSATDSAKSPRAAAAAQNGGSSAPAVQKTGESPAATAADDGEGGGDPDEVPEALTYFESKDSDGKVAKLVKEVRRSGDFLRVYTDLEEGDENSKPAVSLCEWTTQFLREGGDTKPRVFIHGKSEDNGSVVLANKQSDDDDCEVGETR